MTHPPDAALVEAVAARMHLEWHAFEAARSEWISRTPAVWSELDPQVQESVRVMARAAIAFLAETVP